MSSGSEKRKKDKKLSSEKSEKPKSSKSSEKPSKSVEPKPTRSSADARIDELDKKWADRFNRLEALLLSKSLDQPEPTFQAPKVAPTHQVLKYGFPVHLFGVIHPCSDSKTVMYLTKTRVLLFPSCDFKAYKTHISSLMSGNHYTPTF